MGEHAPQMVTAEDLYRLPEDGLHHELVQGRLVNEPPPGARHGAVAARITYLLSQYTEAHRSGIVLANDTGFILHRSPDTVRAPDVAWLRRERYLALENDALMIPGPPDIAIEVLSPGNRPAEIHAKVADYLAAGCTLVWVLEPGTREVHSYRQLLAPEILRGNATLRADDLLPGFSLRVDALFHV
jgi:Uma2 family endonuclease